MSRLRKQETRYFNRFSRQVNFSMNQTKQPTKELIRQWLRDRHRYPAPLPTMEQIQSEMGWRANHSGKAHREIVAEPNHVDNHNA